MTRERNFNTFIFLSMLARSLIDVFIPIVLYQKGAPIQYIICFFLLNNSLGFLLNVPLGYISKMITFKWALIITSFLIGISYYFLLVAEFNTINLIIFAVIHVASMHVYWISRHYYALDVLPKHNLADEVGNIVILSTLALIPISYVGAILMNNFDIELVLVIVVFLYIISVIPLFKIKEHKKDSVGLFTSIKASMNSFPRQSIIFFILAQFRPLARIFFPLFLFIYIKNNYEYIGIFNIAVGIASAFFVYFFARKMDKEKKDYLILSGVLGCIVYLFKLNITDTGLMLLIGLAEGLADRMYDVSFNRNLYALGHQYEPVGYIVMVEGIQHISRVFILLLFVLLSFDLKTLLYTTSLMLIVTGLVGFDDGKGGY